MAKTAFEVLRDRIRKQMNDYADDVSTGACSDFADYRHLCGVIRGLATAERFLIDLANEMERLDE